MKREAMRLLLASICSSYRRELRMGRRKLEIRNQALPHVASRLLLWRILEPWSVL